jgi:hypothetical protein
MKRPLKVKLWLYTTVLAPDLVIDTCAGKFPTFIFTNGSEVPELSFDTKLRASIIVT